jgi:Fur family transcriptional regulator, stress-responsive regulator
VIRVEDNHHHIVCRQCGRTEDVGCVVGERSCLEPAGEHGFAIDAAEVIFRGLCPACAAPDAAGTLPSEEGTTPSAVGKSPR